MMRRRNWQLLIATLLACALIFVWHWRLTGEKAPFHLGGRHAPPNDEVIVPDPSPIGAPPILTQATGDPSRVNLIAFGDWGQNTREEREVAASIRGYAQAGHPIDAGLLLGDNFYFPLTGVDDPNWQRLFEDLYEPANVPFYAILGNHDYTTRAKTVKTGERNKDIEQSYSALHPEGRFHLPMRWYRVDLPEADPQVTVLMLDGNYVQSAFSPGDWELQRQWLAEQLEELRPTGMPSKRRWVICCAHQPIFTNGAPHGDDRRLKEQWLPLFNAHHVDFYLAGHNHCMEHVRIPESVPSLIVSGGGGARLYTEARHHGGRFFKTWGFVYMSLGSESAQVSYIDRNGRTLYTFTRDAAGQEHFNTPEPTTNPSTLPTTLPATLPARQPPSPVAEDDLDG